MTQNLMLDRRFSLAVREAANWKCAKCRKDFSTAHALLHAAHVFGRRNQATRYEPDNCVALCVKCHAYFHDHPAEFQDWVKERLGAKRYEQLKKLAQSVFKGAAA